jgi:hypothetical protein
MEKIISQEVCIFDALICVCDSGHAARKYSFKHCLDEDRLGLAVNSFGILSPRMLCSSCVSALQL